jgi:hypothetical protein
VQRGEVLELWDSSSSACGGSAEQDKKTADYLAKELDKKFGFLAK